MPDRSLTYAIGWSLLLPAQPAWFHRLPAILSEVAELRSEYLDRQSVERLFGVRARRARQLMAGLPSLQIGNAVAVSRAALLERLRSTATGTPFQWETQRRQRVSAALHELRQHAAAARVPLPALPVSTLAPDIHLHPGELRIVFNGAEDLAAKLYALAQMMANDWDAFHQRVTEEE